MSFVAAVFVVVDDDAPVSFRWVLLLLLLVIQLHSLVIEIAFMTSTAVGYPLHRCPSMSMSVCE